MPVVGDNYLYIYCLWVTGPHKGKGYGRALLESCLADARAEGKSGVCMLGAEKQKAWLSDQSFARRFGFVVADTTETGYQLLALSLDGTLPRFTPGAKRGIIDSQELTIYYDAQCPFIHQCVEKIAAFCEAGGIPLSLVRVDSLAQAQALPCPFNNFAVFYRGQFQTVNLLDEAAVRRLLKK